MRGLAPGWRGRVGAPRARQGRPRRLTRGPAYQEAITINARTGIPLGRWAAPARQVAVTVTYVVTRVNLADIAAGKSSTCRYRPAIPGQAAPWPGIAPASAGTHLTPSGDGSQRPSLGHLPPTPQSRAIRRLDFQRSAGSSGGFGQS